MKDLNLSLIIDAVDRATAPLRRVGEALDHVKEHTEKLHHALHKLGLAEFIGGAFFTGAALEAGRSIFALTDKVAEMGEAALRSSEKTGASVEEMQRWSWAAKQLGVDADSLTHAFAMMEVHVGGALKGVKSSANALNLVGISTKDARALSADPSALFQRIIEGFQKIKNPAAQALAAQAIFSRSWSEMAPLLKAPQGEIEELMEQLEKAHVVMTKEDAEAAKQFELAKGNMGLAVSGLGIRIGRELIPRLTEVIKKITDWIENLKSEDIDRFADAVGKLADELPKLLPHVENIIVSIVNLTDNLLKATDNTTLLKVAFGVLATFMAAQALVSIVSTTASIVSMGGAMIMAIRGIVLLLPYMGTLTGAFTALDVVMDANPIGLITLAIIALIAAVAGVIYAIIELHKHWGDIVNFMENGCRKIEAAFTNLEAKMPKWLRTVLNAGGSVLSLQFPALGAIGSLIDGLAHAPPIPKTPSGAPAAAQGPKLTDLIAQWRAKGLIPGNMEGQLLAAESAGAGPHTPAELRSWLRAQRQGGPSADPNHQPHARVSGTIIVKAEPGTKVQSMKKTGDIDFLHMSRGAVAT